MLVLNTNNEQLNEKKSNFFLKNPYFDFDNILVFPQNWITTPVNQSWVAWNFIQNDWYLNLRTIRWLPISLFSPPISSEDRKNDFIDFRQSLTQSNVSSGMGEYNINRSKGYRIANDYMFEWWEIIGKTIASTLIWYIGQSFTSWTSWFHYLHNGTLNIEVSVGLLSLSWVFTEIWTMNWNYTFNKQIFPDRNSDELYTSVIQMEKITSWAIAKKWDILICSFTNNLKSKIKPGWSNRASIITHFWVTFGKQTNLWNPNNIPKTMTNKTLRWDVCFLPIQISIE